MHTDLVLILFDFYRYSVSYIIALSVPGPPPLHQPIGTRSCKLVMHICIPASFISPRVAYTVKPPIKDTPKEDKPPNKGHTKIIKLSVQIASKDKMLGPNSIRRFRCSYRLEPLLVLHVHEGDSYILPSQQVYSGTPL